ncbi:methyl-accepting chemotaxis protein [Natrarchaeobaculum sulfurireducens]|uniref:Sensory protein n=1 Tax=Natrarchaeobaculum sulfurireducens TaxID=2044521 RepID=A0A346PBK9_9EURY|nr:methyl-accepting chemotaxis protein [Natrarchaeobaculum sulfurireducens]AXR76904.1 Sensory protein [Natrarchaeobaculum sulfurireducens]
MSRSGPASAGETADGTEPSAAAIDDDVLTTAQGAVGVVHETSSAVDDELQSINELAAAQVDSMVAVADDVSDLSATIEEVASSASEMADRSEHAAEAVEAGTEASTDAAAAMDDVATVVDAIADDVGRLVESVERIDEIVDVIASIADETNLLALNASIQAAQAGQDGAGFGVVAGEIKSLANQSQDRTGEVETVVDEITAATRTLSERLESAVEIAETGARRAGDAESELETVSAAVADVAAGLDDVSTATGEGARASERVAQRCEETADSAERIDDALDAIESKRYRQTDMIGEVDRALEVATEPRRNRLAGGSRIPAGVDALDAIGGVPEGCRGVVEVDGEAPDRDADRTVASLVATAVANDYAVSLSPTASLDRHTLERAFREHGLDLDRAFDRDRLFVIDLFDSWGGGTNVFDVDGQGLGTVNERIDSRRDRRLLVIGNIAGELHAFGEQATRETTYDNDGGVLEVTDTVVNVVDEDAVPSTLARFYAGAADQVVRVEAGPDLTVPRTP